MGVSSLPNRQSYIGDGSSTVFSFPYYFFSPADLAVYLFDINSSIVTPQTLNTNYTVAGNINAQGIYPSGGTVVMNSAFPSSQQIVITRNPAQIQNFALYQNGPINSLALVQQLDYLTLLVQRLQDEVSRSIQIPDGLGTGNNGAMNQILPQTILNNSSAGAPLVVNSGANGWALGVVATGQSGAIGYAGILPVANGGTGQAGVLNQYGAVYAATTQTMATTPAGAPGFVLTSQGSSVPTFSPIALNVGSGVISVANGGTGLSVLTPGTVLYGTTASQVFGYPVSSLNGSSVIVSRDQNGNFTVPHNSSAIGVLLIANGGTSGSSAVQAITNLWPTPTRGDVLVVNSGALVTKLAVGADGFALIANSSAANPTGLVWQSPLSGGQSVVLKSANYQMTSNDDFVNLTNNGFTVNLPDATTATKKAYHITKIENAISQIFLTASGAQTIGIFGNLVHIWTPNESWTVYPDGANWQVLDHRTDTGWMNMGASIITCSGVNNPAKNPTVLVDTVLGRRRGDAFEGLLNFAQTLTGSTGTGDYLFNPFGVTGNSLGLGINTTIHPVTNLLSGNQVENSTVGPFRVAARGYVTQNAVNFSIVSTVVPFSSSAIRIEGASGLSGYLGSALAALSVSVSYNFAYTLSVAQFEP